MKLKRISLVANDAGKVAQFRSDNGKVSLRWFCPIDREAVGDELELEVQGSHTYYFTSMKGAQKALDQLGTCKSCKELRVIEFIDYCEECRDV